MSPDLTAYLHHLEQSGDGAATAGDESISIIVTYEGDLAPLEAAGLGNRMGRNGKVSGMISVSDLSKLEALPNVIPLL